MCREYREGQRMQQPNAPQPLEQHRSPLARRYQRQLRAKKEAAAGAEQQRRRAHEGVRELEEGGGEEGGVRHPSPLAVELQGGRVVHIPWQQQQSAHKSKVNAKRKYRRDRQEAKFKAEGTSGRTAPDSQLRGKKRSPLKNGPRDGDEGPRDEGGKDSWASAQSPETDGRGRSRRPRDARSEEDSRSRSARRSPCCELQEERREAERGRESR